MGKWNIDFSGASWLNPKSSNLMNFRGFVALSAFLAILWLRICLPKQGTLARSLVWEDPTHSRAVTESEFST